MLGAASRVALVGAGLGALRTAEQLRAQGYEGRLLVIGDEPHAPYNRPPLSKAALAVEATHESLAFRQRLAADDADWRLGEPVTGADLTHGSLTLANGDEVECDAVVAATGVAPRRLPIAGFDDQRHVVRTLDDSVALGRHLRRFDSPRVVVVGAGFIGCEVAASARALGARVTVIGRGAVPLARTVGAVVGTELLRRHEAHGVHHIAERTVSGMEGGSRGVVDLTLDDGAIVSADIVVEALGSTPNVDWLTGNGLDLADGVLTDSWMRAVTATSSEPRVPVAAVGDLARFPNPLFDDMPRRVEHWNIPSETAKRAAAGLLRPGPTGATDSDSDSDSGFRPIPAFWSDQFGFRIQSFGLPSLGTTDVRLLEGQLDDQFAIGYFRDDALVGVVMIGLTARHAHYRRLVGSPALAG